VAQYIGPRYGLILAAVACAVAAVLGVAMIRALRRADSARRALPARAPEVEAELEVVAAAR
jgi:hypothetical protein